MKHPWSLWLRPEGKDQIKFKRLIDELSIENQSCKFEPHVTLFGRVTTPPDPLFEFFEDQTIDQKQIASRIKDLRSGLPPWRSLFLEIERNPTLDLFQRRIIEPLIHLRDYDFNPHLSLVYSDQEATGRSIKDIPTNRNIRFGSLAVVQIPNNIDEWNIISEFKFNFSR